MFTYGELFVLGVAAVVLIGPKEMPRVARALGQLTGRAVGTVTQLRARFEEATKDAQLSELHTELQQGMNQLQQIRAEMRSGVDLFNPGPVARRLMQPLPAGKAVSGRPSDAESTPAGPVGADRAEIAASLAAARGDDGASFQPLPLSAVKLGLVPPRAGTVTSGADILSDAFEESKIAERAAEFFRREAQGTDATTRP